MSLIIQQAQEIVFSNKNQEIKYKLTNVIANTLPSSQALEKDSLSFNDKLSIFAFKNKSSKTIPVPTKWIIQLQHECIKIRVYYIDPESQLPLRITSQRIKIQFSSFLRKLNVELPREAKFKMETYTGLISYHFLITYDSFSSYLGTPSRGFPSLIKINQKEVSTFVYQILDFCGLSKITTNLIDKQKNPQNESALQTKQKLLKRLNNFKILLNKTRYYSGAIQKFIQMRQSGVRRNQQQQISIMQSMKMYFENLKQLNSFALGIEPIIKSNTRVQQILSHEYNMVKHYLKTKKSSIQNVNNPRISKKTVWGIEIISKKSPLIQLSDKGAHSKVYKQKLEISILWTINRQIYKQIQRDTGIVPKPETISTNLAIKKCTREKQASVNSFLNQLKILQHFKNQQSAYMARYYLQLKDKEHRDADDSIYMQYYQKNIYQLLMNAKLMNLQAKVELAFRIAMGLCFLAENTIVHRDIKLQNIVVDKENNPKIIDFGSACPAFNSQRFEVYDNRLLCTKDYHIKYSELDPLIRNKYSEETYQRHELFDVYSYGIVLKYIFWDDLKKTPIQESLQDYSTRGIFINNLFYLINRCTQVDPQQRPGPGQIAGFLGVLVKFIQFK